MGAEYGTDFLNSDFPMYAAGGVAIFCVYRAYVVSCRWRKASEALGVLAFVFRPRPHATKQGHDDKDKMRRMIFCDTL